ncbi:GmrSD restriction endonuclease domain-containing protein [Nocardia sp. CA-119907]|uniref:GmrSD restriction endonuclease domain-containing protein n=1 Tax=Nocardia sp. CA-119907 TaxID=3239973 RepID=UPI003D990F19
MVAAQETSLQRILEGSSQYLVPLYQRPYGWGDEQLQELWNDVIQLAEDRTEEPQATHFIGSVVLAPTPAGVAGAVTRFLVVDGQQRLTTLTLLLAAIRDYLRAVDGSASRDTDRIHNQLLTNQYHDDPDRLKLLPTQVDRPAYTAIIDGSATDDNGNVGSAYRFFSSRLAELTAADDMPFGLSQVVQAVVSGLSVVSISAHPGDNVHRIFQSLNNTGLKLTQGDLLRNYLFMRLPHRSEEIYRTHWLPLQASLDNERIETLFWLDMLHKRPNVKQGQTFAAQQIRLEKLTSEEQIVAEIERIARLGRLYRLMIEPEAEPHPEVRVRLTRLAEWDSTTPAPLVLHLLLLRDRGEASSEQVARALLYIESLLVRRFLVGRVSQGLNRLFAETAQQLDAALPVDTALRVHFSAGRKHYATDKQLTEAIVTVPLYLNGRNAHRKILMTWIEDLFLSRETVQPESLSIEHVMPQSLSAQWRAELSAEYGADEVDVLHERYLHTLGNLTLTGYNESLSNHDFARKRETLRASSIRMNQDIAAHESWGPSQIEKRGLALAERIIEFWPGPADESAFPDNPTWAAMHQLLSVLPAGRWTTYGDLGNLLGTAAHRVGTRLRSHPAPNAHRVLDAHGMISYGPGDIPENPRQLLESEGVTFSATGRAASALRLTSDELGQLHTAAQNPDPDLVH